MASNQPKTTKRRMVRDVVNAEWMMIERYLAKNILMSSAFPPGSQEQYLLKTWWSRSTISAFAVAEIVPKGTTLKRWSS